VTELIEFTAPLCLQPCCCQWLHKTTVPVSSFARGVGYSHYTHCGENCGLFHLRKGLNWIVLISLRFNMWLILS